MAGLAKGQRQVKEKGVFQLSEMEESTFLTEKMNVDALTCKLSQKLIITFNICRPECQKLQDFRIDGMRENLHGLGFSRGAVCPTTKLQSLKKKKTLHFTALRLKNLD